MATIKELAEQAGLKFSKDWGECYTGNAQIERFAELIRQDEREAISNEYFMSLDSDLENGVKWLNEKAHKDFKTNYPELNEFSIWLSARRNHVTDK